MATVLLVIHLMIAAGLVSVVLLQKSEGGALGIGGSGGGAGGFLSGRGTANLLTRVTAGLAAAFFTTSILLTIVAGGGADQGRSLLDEVPAAPSSGAVPKSDTPSATQPAAPAPGDESGGSSGGILDKLK